MQRDTSRHESIRPYKKYTYTFAGMDSQVDVAIHTIVQTSPPALYYHLKVVEQLLWDPWGQAPEAEYAMLLMVCCSDACCGFLEHLIREISMF